MNKRFFSSQTFTPALGPNCPVQWGVPLHVLSIKLPDMKLTIYLHLGKLTLKKIIKAQRYCSTFSLTSALDEGGWSATRLDRFTPGEYTRYSLYRRLYGFQDRSGRLRKISPPPGFGPRPVFSYLHLVPRLRKSGAILLFPLTFLYVAKADLPVYFYHNIIKWRAVA